MLTPEQVADHIGVTPYSDMRPFVVQAVKYAREMDAASSGGAPTVATQQCGLDDVAGLVGRLRSPLAISGVHRDEAAATLTALSARAEADRVDAERWRALLRCARIRMQGSAGFNPKTGERHEYSNATGKYEKSDRGWVHFGAEFWSVYPGAEDEDRVGRWGTRALIALADDVLLKEADAARSALAKEAGNGQ